MDERTLRRLDRLVRDARYPNRSRAIEGAIASQLEHGESVPELPDVSFQAA